MQCRYHHRRPRHNCHHCRDSGRHSRHRQNRKGQTRSQIILSRHGHLPNCLCHQNRRCRCRPRHRWYQQYHCHRRRLDHRRRRLNHHMSRRQSHLCRPCWSRHCRHYSLSCRPQPPYCSTHSRRLPQLGLNRCRTRCWPSGLFLSLSCRRACRSDTRSSR